MPPTSEIDRDVRLRSALAAVPAVGAEISNLELLDDPALWNAAQTRMPQPDSERMEELHRRQRVTGLSEVEAEELARLEQQYERVILVRSHSTAHEAAPGGTAPHLPKIDSSRPDPVAPGHPPAAQGSLLGDGL